MASFQRLLRFKNPQGTIFYGESPVDGTVTAEQLLGASVKVYNNSSPFDDDFTFSGQTEKVAEVRLLSPILFL